MNISLKWLKEFVDINPGAREFAEDMTMSGTKVETYEELSDKIKNVVVGKIIDIKKHPDADKLLICQIDAGQTSPLQIVTGADNISVGDLVPVALHKSLLPNGTKISKGNLRGIESNGMLCSLGELNMSLHDFPYAVENGIFIIKEECKPGDDIKSIIGYDDTLIEFEITPNRPDCLSMIGIAREAAATYKVPLKLHKPSYTSDKSDKIENYISVDVQNTNLCPRYSAKIIKDIKIAPSPKWMRERLRNCGVRPINNIVDITNYIMLEYAQPMHAFDYSCLEGKKIIVRNAAPNEKIITLDNTEHTLNENMLVISDTNKAVALAGVMGGLNSEIKESTKTVVFESANFNGSNIRTTSKNVGLRSDSSAKFEKGLDPQNTLEAVDRACELVEMLGCGTVVDGTVDIKNYDQTPHKIKLDCDFISNFLGCKIEKQFMIDTLSSLGFAVENDIITVPSYRADVEGKADIAEEIARIYGYNNIPSTTFASNTKGGLNKKQKLEKEITELLVSNGLYQAITYSFISPKHFNKLNIAENDRARNAVVISNPLGEDTSIMRTMTEGSMLEALSHNYALRNLEAELFEFGKIYIKNQDENTLPDEKDILTIGMYGKNADYYTIKGITENIMETINVTITDVKEMKDSPSYHPYRSANLYSGDKLIAKIGQIHPAVSKNYDIDQEVYMAVINLYELYNLANDDKQYKPMPKFPAVIRDIAVTVNRDTTVLSLENIIKKAGGNLIESINLFDVYTGSQIERDKKSVAFSYKLRADDRTLSESEIKKISDKVIDELEKAGAVLRK